MSNQEWVMVPVELVQRAAKTLERVAHDTTDGRNAAEDLRIVLAAAPQAEQAVEPSPALGTELDQPQYTAHDMASQAAQGFRDGQAAALATDVSALVEALTELCDEIDKHEIHAAISKTSISWFKRKARKALAAHRKRE